MHLIPASLAMERARTPLGLGHRYIHNRVTEGRERPCESIAVVAGGTLGSADIPIDNPVVWEGIRYA